MSGTQLRKDGASTAICGVSRVGFVAFSQRENSETVVCLPYCIMGLGEHGDGGRHLGEVKVDAGCWSVVN